MHVIDLQTKVKQVMTDRVISVLPTTVMTEVVQIFRSSQIHHLPVLDGRNIAGIISTTEIDRLEHHFTLFETTGSEKVNAALFASLTARDVMTSRVVSINENETVQLAADVFRENLFRALPVVDRDKNSVGILTPYDLMIFAYCQAPAGLSSKS
jgi:CBS-domain-containing membrane protein